MKKGIILMKVLILKANKNSNIYLVNKEYTLHAYLMKIRPHNFFSYEVVGLQDVAVIVMSLSIAHMEWEVTFHVGNTIITRSNVGLQCSLQYYMGRKQ